VRAAQGDAATNFIDDPDPATTAAAVRERLQRTALVIFDKDGTLIEFDAMWGGWLIALAHRLEADTGRALDDQLYAAFGFDASTGRPTRGSRLSAMPMARLREVAVDVLVETGMTRAAALTAIERQWQAPDPVTLARPLAPLQELFRSLRGAGSKIGVATIDDRLPTERTLNALGIRELVDGVACADDGLAIKPAPDMVLALCRQLGVDPADSTVIGDSPSDLAMGRAAGAGFIIGVLTGVGSRAELAPIADVVVPSIASLLP
jgi:phosphoglycolate phosphatase